MSRECERSLNYDLVNSVLDDLPEGSELVGIPGATHALMIETPFDHASFWISSVIGCARPDCLVFYPPILPVRLAVLQYTPGFMNVH